LIGVALGTFLSSILFRLLQVNYACSIVNLSRWVFWTMVIKHWVFGAIILLGNYFILSFFQINSLVDILLICMVSSVIYVIFTSRYILSYELKITLCRNLSGKIPEKILTGVFNIQLAESL
jgi:hypothetical protein